MLFSTLAVYVLLATSLTGVTRAALKQLTWRTLALQGVFILSVTGYAYSMDKGSAGFLLERQLAILLFPLVLPLAFKVTEQRVTHILHAFTAGVMLAVSYLFLSAFSLLEELNLPLQKLFTREFFNHQFSAPLGIHAGYLSLYVCFGLFHLLRQLFVHPRWRAVLVPSIGLLLVGLLFLASRNVIIAGALIGLFVFPNYFVKNKTRFYAYAGLALLSGYLCIANINYLRERFSSELVGDIRPGGNSYDNFSSVEPRALRWKSAAELIKHSPVIGYGTGDEIPLLRASYIKSGLYISYLESFNAHNQYLSIAIKHGLLGLLGFLLLFSFYLHMALKRRSYIYTCFLFLLLIGFFTENLLDANKGIFFFAFFNTLLGYLQPQSVVAGSLTKQY